MQRLNNKGIKNFLLKNASFFALFAICILIVVLELIVNGETNFINPENLNNVLMQVTINGVLAVGMTFVILTGGIDLSVGSMLALMGVIYLVLGNFLFGFFGANLSFVPAVTLSIFISLVLTLLVGFLIGLVNGCMISRFRIPPFIITLGMMSIGRGGALLISGATGLADEPAVFKKFASIDFPKSVSAVLLAAALCLCAFFMVKAVKKKRKYSIPVDKLGLMSNIMFLALGGFLSFYVFIGHSGIPLFVLVFIVIAIAASTVLRSTIFGRKVYAIGGNEEAARLSGINVARVKTVVYISMALLATVAALLTVARQGGISPGVSGMMGELDAIASVVIGGTSLSGGIGTIEGTILGALIMGILNNGMNLLSIPTNWGYVMKGLVVVLAVWFDITSRKKFR